MARTKALVEEVAQGPIANDRLKAFLGSFENLTSA